MEVVRPRFAHESSHSERFLDVTIAAPARMNCHTQCGYLNNKYLSPFGIFHDFYQRKITNLKFQVYN
jgi:hypothetical protein